MSEKVTAGVDLDSLEIIGGDMGPTFRALIAELRAARAVVAAARAYVTGPGREDFDPAQIAAQLDRALAEYDRLTGERQ